MSRTIPRLDSLWLYPPNYSMLCLPRAVGRSLSWLVPGVRLKRRRAFRWNTTARWKCIDVSLLMACSRMVTALIRLTCRWWLMQYSRRSDRRASPSNPLRYPNRGRGPTCSTKARDSTVARQSHHTEEGIGGLEAGRDQGTGAPSGAKAPAGRIGGKERATESTRKSRAQAPR